MTMNTSPVNRSELLARARAVLELNWTGSFTKPSLRQYPHQWSWDSAFIAMGYARYDQDRAEQELRSLFDAQWSDGRVPHIVFHDVDPAARSRQPAARPPASSNRPSTPPPCCTSSAARRTRSGR